MRADLFFKKTKIIKRRSQAKIALDKGLVTKNNLPIKPSYDLKIGDILKVSFYKKTLTFKITSVDEKLPSYETIGEN